MGAVTSPPHFKDEDAKAWEGKGLCQDHTVGVEQGVSRMLPDSKPALLAALVFSLAAWSGHSQGPLQSSVSSFLQVLTASPTMKPSWLSRTVFSKR